ncbi:CBS domain-containing protein [Acuticoccus sp. M5D2P5]|uniref:CBS domain-containing protein n=1 Tax=Acuticoccus kalidii TaxID=2910977 RepID=UPI001F15FF8C|nr:CBS domain-containing protein [Acuticoccus kalidii]MCF3936700.1 CBS domain-containing protein [Acuticoccus kalidii]
MQAKDIMNTAVITVTADTPITDAARRLMEHHISALPVVDASGKLVGLVSEGDFMRRLEDGDDGHRRAWWLLPLADPAIEASHYVKAHGHTVGDVMTKQVITVNPSTPVGEIAHILETKRIKRVPVVDGHTLVGIVSRADLLRAVAARGSAAIVPASADDETIREAVLTKLRSMSWAPLTRLNVVVNDGVVSFWGFVDDKELTRAMKVAAEEVPGVRGVEMNVSETPAFGWAV